MICIYKLETRKSCISYIDVLYSGAQSCPTLSGPSDYSLPGSSAHGIFQVRILEWGAISYSRGSSPPRNRTSVSCVFFIGRWILYHLPYTIYIYTILLLLLLSHFSCVQLFATPWTIAHQAPLSMEISQARILQWVAIPFSKESSQTRDQTCDSCTAGKFFTIEPPERMKIRSIFSELIINSIRTI